MSVPAFTVDDVFVIEGRGPVLTSRKGVPLGTFSPGDRIQCGHRVARIMGVEAFGDRQRGLLVDADPAELWAGQVWIGYPPDTEPLTIEELLRALIVGDVWGGGFIDVGDDRAIIDGFCLLPPAKAKWLGELVERLEAEVERGKLQAR